MRTIAAFIMLAAVVAVLLLIGRSDPHPLLIDATHVAAAEDRWCDFPKRQGPLLAPPGLYLPNGVVRWGEDGGIA